MNGDLLGRYRLLERIGIGGMAEVFVAKNLGGGGAFSRSVVVKRMLPQLTSDADAVGMFLDEARLGAKLQHPNIASVVDLGEVDGDYFMVLEFVDGADLGVFQSRARQRKVSFPVEHAAWIVSRAAQGLHFAHEAKDPETRAPLGVVHRDVSPSNILIGKNGDVKMADFGVARSSLQSVRTGTGAIKGKISYMSPEQLTGDVLTARSDVYALGIVLWELLAGVRLHEGKNDAQIIGLTQKSEFPTPSSKNPAVPPALDALVARCLAKNVSDRPPTAAAVAEALEQWMLVTKGAGRVAFEAWIAREQAIFEPDPPGLSSLLLASGPRKTPSRGGAIPLPVSGVGLKKARLSGSPTTPHDGLKLAQRGPERKRELVLYVEDEPENRDVAELRLRRSYELLLAANDEEACAILRERGTELSAILMDIQLKGSALDGVDLVRLVRGSLADAKKPAYARGVPVLSLPILFVTAYGARHKEDELLAAGAQKVIAKPVNFSELTLALVDAHLRRASKP